ncbi:MAG: periplasmic heavy metal sensor [Chthoniobacteraceae bacterium]
MKPAARALTLLALVAVVACAACWFTARYLHRQEGRTDAHAGIHTQLGITHEQHEALEPIEERYAEQKKHFAEMLRIANDELGKAILEDRSDSPRVKAAVARIHQAQGELQNATLQHIFEMQPVLTPQQYDKLLKLTAEALGSTQHGR